MTTPRETYTSFILAPFFRWWWALVTGLAGFLSYHFAPETGYQMSATGVLLITLGSCTCAFLAFSVMYQGWELFRRRYSFATVLAIQKNRDFDADWVFVIATDGQLPLGTVLDVHRTLGEVEVPFALVEVVAETSKGRYQGVPRWLSPAHIRDFTSGRFSTLETIVARNMTITRIRDFADASK